MVKTCSSQQVFHPCFVCFTLYIFPHGDSWKSFSYPRFNKSLNDTSQRQEDVHKSGFLWSCSWIVIAANEGNYLCGGVEDVVKGRQLGLPLPNSFTRVFLFWLSSHRCIFLECYCHCRRQASCCFAPFVISWACHTQTCYNSGVCMDNKLRP